MRMLRFGACPLFVLFSLACSPAADPAGSPERHEILSLSSPDMAPSADDLACKMPSEGVAPGPDLDKSMFEPLAPTVTVNVHLIGLTAPSPVSDQQVHQQIAILNQNYQGRATFELGEITRNQTSDENWYWSSFICDNLGPAPLPADLASLHSGRTDVAEIFVRGGEGGCSFFPWLPGVGSTRDYTYVPEYPLQGGSGHRFYLTHELGHWLGLWHTHQNGCGAPGDEVEDTPYEAIPSADCPAGRDTCPGGGPDPVRNFMDHGENCANELTQGQFARIESLWYLREGTEPPSENDAEFVDWSVPSSMNTNATASVWIRYRNTGTTTWTYDDLYALGSQNPPNNVLWGLNRVRVQHDVPPQTEYTFNFTIRAPGGSGSYPFTWRMVQDATEDPWFGERTPGHQILVGGGGPCPQPLPAPTAIAPVGPITDPTPEFAWTPVAGAAGYTLYVQYKDGDWVIPPVYGWPSTSYTPPQPLPVGDDLIWKVRGVCNGAGGEYSNVPEFHILFADVPLGHPARPSIEEIYARPRYISEHCGLDGAGQVRFCPDSPLLRKNAARWLLKAKFGAGHVPPPATGIFLDVPPSDEFAPWIEELHALGITAGCGFGRFCPDAALTRGEAAVFFLLAKEPGYRPPACWIQLFDDVPCSAPFADWINEIAWRSIALGCDNRNFCPTAALSREDASIWLDNLFDG